MFKSDFVFSTYFVNVTLIELSKTLKVSISYEELSDSSIKTYVYANVELNLFLI